MPEEQMSMEEVARRGEEIYQSRLRPLVEAEHKDQFLVLDVASGDYEIDAQDVVVSFRLLERRPKGVLYGVRIGHQAAYKMGMRFRYRD